MKENPNEKRWYIGEDAKIIEKTIAKYRGSNPNPLNMMTFGEILKAAKEGRL